MASIQADVQLMLKKETTYGTGVTVDSGYEPISETLKKTVDIAQGAGLRVANPSARSDRRLVVGGTVEGDIVFEVLTKSVGKIMEAALGSGTSTQITGAAYQQVFTVTASDYLPSYTIQVGLPLLGGGSISPQTFTGMQCSGFDFAQDAAGIAQITTRWVGQDMATGTALASVSYPSGTRLLGFANAAITVGGSVTAATTTDLATGGTAVSNVRDFRLTYENNLDTNGKNLGGAGLRSRAAAKGLSTITGSFTAEFDATTLRAAYLAQTGLAIVVTLTDGTAITGSHYPAFQIHLPEVKLDGEVPAANAGDVITQTVDFTALYDGSNSPIRVAIVTEETAI